jgi:hypothetical protein
MILLGTGLVSIGYYVYDFFQSEGDNWEERYSEYRKERNEYLMNRKLSKESIEMRKTVQIVDNFHHDDRDGLPVFHTYFQTNKYLDINEIDQELHILRQKINADSLDVRSLFVKGFFFTADREKPYRVVTAKYDNLKGSNPSYKQITKPRSTKSFQIQSFPSTPFKLNLQINDNYRSGVIDALVYEIHINPIANDIKVFSLNPTPELIDEDLFSNFLKNNSSLGERNILHQALTIYQYLDDQKMVYRSQILDEHVQYSTSMTPVRATFNWELTLDDETAFIRIRSEDIKGYYLVGKTKGQLFQAKVSFTNNKEVRTDYTIQLIP